MQPINYRSFSPTRDTAMSDCNATMDSLYRHYYAPIYHRIYSLTHDHEQTRDLTQDTFLKAFDALPKLKHDGNIFGWLYTIATNTAYDDMRRKYHTNISLDAAEEEVATIADDTDEYAAVEERELIQIVLSRLPSKEYEGFEAWIQNRYQHIQYSNGQKQAAYRAKQLFRHLYQVLESEGAA